MGIGAVTQIVDSRRHQRHGLIDPLEYLPAILDKAATQGVGMAHAGDNRLSEQGLIQLAVVNDHIVGHAPGVR